MGGTALKNGGFFAILAECDRIEPQCQPTLLESRFLDSTQFHSFIGGRGLHLLVSYVKARECVLVDTPTDVALGRFSYQKGVNQMSEKQFPLDSNLYSDSDQETITVTLAVEDVLAIVRETGTPEGAALLAASRTLWLVVTLLSVQVMTAAERAAVCRYVEEVGERPLN